jgi:protoheme ferro-lyase
LEMLGTEAPFDKRECVMKLASTLELDKSVFERIFQCESEEEVWLQAETDEVFGKYLDQIQQVIDAVEGQ